jgi:hypothetical protein
MNLLQIPIAEKKLESRFCHFLLANPQVNIPQLGNIVLKLNFNTWIFLLHIYLTFLGNRRA